MYRILHHTTASGGNFILFPLANSCLAQEFIEEHYREAVRIEDLCRVTGVAVRTLQRCFREYFDVTISEFLKTVRLNAAYRSLSASHTDHSTVAAIALQNGFTHLGRFSVEFRECFGESPSTTLVARDGHKSHLNEIPDTTFAAAVGSIH